MTYLEKYMKEHPGVDPYYVYEQECCIYGDCPFIGDESIDCELCWDREIPEKKLSDVLNETGYIMNTDNPNVKEKPIHRPEYDEPRGQRAKLNLVGDIPDSGARREFETGAVRDIQEGKGRMDLLPWAAIMEVSKHCENGAKKYGEHNIDKGIPTHSLCDSAARHLAKYLDGWEDEPHLLAAAWNLLWAIQMHVKNKEMIDTPWKNENTTNTTQE